MKRLLVAIVALSFAFGCDGQEIREQVGGLLSVDLTPCLFSPTNDASCRGGLSQIVGQSRAVNACLVLQSAVPQRIVGLPARFDTGGLNLVGKNDIAFPPNTDVNVTVFFLNETAPSDACSQFNASSECLAAQGCALRLGPAQLKTQGSQPSIANFATEDGRCLSALPADQASPLSETCDGRDNDCDGVLDEGDVVPTGPCDECGQSWECLAGQVVCPSTARDDSNCDGLDDDCDLRIDENGNCSRRCSSDRDCESTPGLSVCDIGTGQCIRCDPETSAGCGDPNNPICAADGGRCQPCNTNDECNTLGDPLRRICLSGVCGDCAPDAPRAGCPDESRPICDAGAPGGCRGCADDNECGGADAICTDSGTCSGCDPVTFLGCAPDSRQPICDDTTRRCVPCDSDRECESLSINRPFCTPEVGCGECINSSSEGCDEGGDTPICANRRCVACSTNLECQRRNGGLNYCARGGLGLNGDILGQCVSCDPSVAESCPDAARPICGALGTCRACESDNECPPGALCTDGRCQVCDPNNNQGCPSTSPVCRGGACVACEQDLDCQTPWAGLGQPFCVDGECVSCERSANLCLPTEGCNLDTGRCEPCDCDGISVNGEALCLTPEQCVQCIESNDCPSQPPLAGAMLSNIHLVCGAENTCDPCASDQECDLAFAGRLPFCDGANPGRNRCRFCRDDQRGPGSADQVDSGCTAAHPRCLSSGVKCCAEANDADCILDRD